MGAFNDRLCRKLKPDILNVLGEVKTSTAANIFEAIKNGEKQAIVTDKRVVMALTELQVEGKVWRLGSRGKAGIWVLQESRGTKKS